MDNNSDNLTPPYMLTLSESLLKFGEILEQFYATIPPITPVMEMALKNFASAIETSHIESLNMELVNKIFKQASLYSPTCVLPNTTEHIALDDESVVLSDEAVEQLTEVLAEVEEDTTISIQQRMSIKDFLLYVLLPILAILLPMIQAEYHHLSDSREDQKQQELFAEFQENLLKIENQELEEEVMQTEYLKQILQLLTDESIILPEDAPESLGDNSTPPVQMPAEPQDTPPVSEIHGDSSADSDTVLDAPENLDTDE